MASSTFPLPSLYGSRPANAESAATPTTAPPNMFSFSDNNPPVINNAAPPDPNKSSLTPTNSPPTHSSQFTFFQPNDHLSSAKKSSPRSPDYSNQLLSLNALSLSPKTPATFLPIYPTQLLSDLSPPLSNAQSSSSTTLIIDIRSRPDFLASRIIGSVGFNLPTTLLRRPLYGLDRIYDSLETAIDKARFNRYKTCLKGHASPPCDIAPLERIVVLDADSRSVNPSHPLTLVLRKFEQAGFAGELVWLYGGFEMLVTDERAQPGSVLEHSDPSGPDADADNGGSVLRMSLSLPPSLTGSPPLSTHPRPPSASLRLTRAHLKRPPISLSMLPVSLPPPVPAPPPNPFFDNIRQLTERLSLDASLQNLAPFNLPPLALPQRDLPRLPPFLRRLIEESPTARATRLAHEFHDLEMAEQRRLQDVMSWESSRGSTLIPHPNLQIPLAQQQAKGGVLDGAAQHPFSISAGVELGYKNRYKNIWPYEHTRIRLNEGATRRNGTDYVNASLISFRVDGAPAGLEQTGVGRRRYIATQGPLASTFEDFWSVVGAQDVGLIVMITRRHEAGREKCGDYVRNGQYGETVVCVDAGGAGESDGEAERTRTGDFFGFGPSRPARLDGVVQKTLKLSRATRPDLPARRVAHIQYRLWPDFDVPPAVDEVLELVTQCQAAVKQVSEANERAVQIHCQRTGEEREQVRALVGTGAGPVMVHCSAGVGRTGSFIVLDLMMEVLKAQYGASTHRPRGGVGTPAARKTPNADTKVPQVAVKAGECPPRQAGKVAGQVSQESMKMDRDVSREATKMDSEALREAIQMNSDTSGKMAKMDGDVTRETTNMAGDASREAIKVDEDTSRKTAQMEGTAPREAINMSGDASRMTGKVEGDGPRETTKMVGEIDTDASRKMAEVGGDALREAPEIDRRAPRDTMKLGDGGSPKTTKMDGNVPREANKMEDGRASREANKLDGDASLKILTLDGNAPREINNTDACALHETPKGADSHTASTDDRPESRLQPVSRVPRFLESELCDCQANVAPIWQHNPVMAVVNEMREQRMSMVANYRQYVFVHEVLMKFMIKELEIPTMGREEEHSSNNSVNVTKEDRTEPEELKTKKLVKDERIKAEGLAGNDDGGGGVRSGGKENGENVEKPLGEERLTVIATPAAAVGGTVQIQE